MEKKSQGCTLDCFDCCKFDIYVEDNKVIKIQGDKNHPFTKGFICKKGLAHLDRLYHKDRKYKPLLKVNGEFKEISFEEALNIVAGKIKEYKEKYTSKSILYYEQYGNGSILKSIGEVFCNFLGGVSFSKGGPCWSAGMEAQKRNFGEVKSHALEDMINSKTIFIWGKNPGYTSIHTIQSIKKAKAKGSKIVVIDPIYTKTAEMADKYIRIKPNGDGALALAMGKIIIEKNLVDLDYINKYVNGYEEYKKYVVSLNLDDLINICGVSKEDIEELVSLYTSKYSTILLGYGIQKYKNGGNTINLVDILGAITGQIGESGGGVNYANRVFPQVLDSDPYGSANYAKARYYYVSHIAEFIKASLENRDYYDEEGTFVKESKDKNKKYNIPIKMAIITKSNLLNQLPDLNNLKEALSKVEFKVCLDMFLTDTARECDLFIPTTSTLESEDIIYSSMMNPYIIYNEKVVEPKERLMDEYYFFMELAKKLEIKEYPRVSKKDYLTKVIEPFKKYNKNMSIDYLKNNYFTLHKPVPWEDKNFETKSGKFEILLNGNLYIKSEEESAEGDEELRLLTIHGKDSLSSQHYMDYKGMAVAYINEKMSRRFQVNNDELIYLENNNGKIQVKLKIDNSISDNVVMMYAGWWKKHGNPNYLTDSGISDIGGQVTYNETMVKIKTI